MHTAQFVRLVIVVFLSFFEMWKIKERKKNQFHSKGNIRFTILFSVPYVEHKGAIAFAIPFITIRKSTLGWGRERLNQQQKRLYVFSSDPLSWAWATLRRYCWECGSTFSDFLVVSGSFSSISQKQECANFLSRCPMKDENLTKWWYASQVAFLNCG